MYLYIFFFFLYIYIFIYAYIIFYMFSYIFTVCTALLVYHGLICQKRAISVNSVVLVGLTTKTLTQTMKCFLSHLLNTG